MMRYTLVCCLILFAFTQSATSQKDTSLFLQYGGEFTATPIIHFMDDGPNARNFGTGAFFFANSSNKLELKTGVLYHFKKYNVVKSYSTTDSIISFRYINIPLIVNIGIIRTKKQISYLSAGVLFGLPAYVSKGLKWESVDYMNNPNISLQFGIGHRWVIKKNILFQIEPNLSFFTSPIKYGDLSFCYPSSCYVEKTYGVHSKTVFRLLFSIRYVFYEKMLK
jgi:hypothetical protein